MVRTCPELSLKKIKVYVDTAACIIICFCILMLLDGGE